MKGYLHTMEAVIAAIVLLTFMFLVDIPDTKSSAARQIELSETQVRSHNLSHVQSTYRHLFPLQTVATAINDVRFRAGKLSTATHLVFVNDSVDKARLVIWFDQADNVTVSFNGKQLLSHDQDDSVVRRTLSPLLASNNVTIRGDAVVGTYHVFLTNITRTGPLSGTRHTHRYYNRQLQPVYVEVGVQ